MNRRPVFAMIVVSALLASTLSGTLLVGFAADVQRYPFQGVSVGVEIWAPVENGSYLGSTVTLNVSVQFSIFAYESERGEIEILYRDVEYLYSIDDGEWKTIPLYSVRNSWCPSHNPGRYYEQVYCWYVVALQDLSEGWHSIRVNERPDLSSYSASSSRSSSLVRFKMISTTGISVFSPQNITYRSDEVPLIFRVNEPAASVVYSLDEEANVTVQGDTNLTGLTNGTHCLAVYAVDSSGATADVATVTFEKAVPKSEAFSSRLTLLAAVSVVVMSISAVGFFLHFRKRRCEELAIRSRQ